LPPLVGGGSRMVTGGSIAQATSQFQAGEQQQATGKLARAARTFGRVADDYPLADVAPQARYNQAQLLDQVGEPLKAFEAYQKFISRYRSSRLYTTAITRQEQVAHAAADGEIKNSFLGLRSRVSAEKIVAMLEKVRDNAPQAASASRSQFSIGEFHQSRGEATEAIAAYQKLVSDYPASREAPEGQYRIGAILTKQAEGGNQDRANLNRAREAYLDYIARYPNYSNVGQARAALAKLGGQSLQRSYEIAEFYRKSGEKDSAVFYYREVVRLQTSGPLRDQAVARLRELGAQ
jgi:outer membrane protein assembly factor BamD